MATMARCVPVTSMAPPLMALFWLPRQPELPLFYGSRGSSDFHGSTIDGPVLASKATRASMVLAAPMALVVFTMASVASMPQVLPVVYMAPATSNLVSNLRHSPWSYWSPLLSRHDQDYSLDRHHGSLDCQTSHDVCHPAVVPIHQTDCPALGYPQDVVLALVPSRMMYLQTPDLHYGSTVHHLPNATVLNFLDGISGHSTVILKDDFYLYQLWQQ